MPLIPWILAGFGLGGWTLSQADDAIETATGEKAGIPPLFILLVILLGLWLWRKTKAS